MVAMSPHSMERSAWSSTRWLWIFLVLCLIGWRINSRVEQYRPLVGVGHHSQAAFFDANERNIASIDAARSHSRHVAQKIDLLFPVASPEPPAQPTYRSL